MDLRDTHLCKHGEIQDKKGLEAMKKSKDLAVLGTREDVVMAFESSGTPGSR